MGLPVDPMPGDARSLNTGDFRHPYSARERALFKTKKSKGWCVLKFEDATKEDTGEKLAEAWLQLHEGDFNLKGFEVDNGVVYLAGILV